MNQNTELLGHNKLPQFLAETEILRSYLKELEYAQVKSIWKCNDQIAGLNYERINAMNLYSDLTPAILAYEGIQYKHIAPSVFQVEEFQYLEEHLRILSGFYGIVRPFDGIVPYRLEMQAKLGGDSLNSLYDFWEDKLAQQLFSESNCIVNLASKEYSRCISNYATKNIHFLTCIFGELNGDKIVEKGTQVKMARGEMVRFMAENQVKELKELKQFNRLNFLYAENLSDENTYVFIKGEKRRC